MGIANQDRCQVFKAPSEGMENEPMKNSKLIACALAVAGLVGCGGVEGTYKLDKDETKKAAEADIAKLPADQQAMAKLMMSSDKMDKMDMTLELKKDNTISMKMTMDGKADAKEETGTWKKEGDDVVLTSDGKDIHCKKDGKKLSCVRKHASGESTTVFTKS
jgi:hypothetical protein